MAERFFRKKSKSEVKHDPDRDVYLTVNRCCRARTVFKKDPVLKKRREHYEIPS